MQAPIEDMVGQRLMLAFSGTGQIPATFLEAMRAYRPAGVTLFRSLNIENPRQVRELTAHLQDAARRIGLPPLLIAADQEGGQLMAIGGGTTALPGNMALGAASDPELARRAGEVLGAELAAVGVNVNYAPCCDVNINPRNPGIGIRSFGEEPGQVAQFSAALVEGLQSRGVAATAKHFPGHGDTDTDSHAGLPRLEHDLARLQSAELPPFAGAINADVKLVMTAHIALPALDGPDAPPATLSRSVLKGLLREQLGFQGVAITDAMDMHAIAQGDALGGSAVRALEAGADLLLLTAEPADQERVFRAVKCAMEEGGLDVKACAASLERISSLKKWIASQPVPSLEVVGCASHREVADEIARRSITLVRNQAGLLPLHLPPTARIAAVVPRPADLTPADTSSYVVPTLAGSLRAYHPLVDELIVPQSPSDSDIAALVEQLRVYDVIVLGTLNAFMQPSQASLAAQILRMGISTVVASLRLPYDLAVTPQAQTYVCTYSILEPSMQALASALFGFIPFEGRLPVGIPGLYPCGFRGN